MVSQGANSEGLDALAVSALGRALDPLAKLLHRNAALSLNYETARALALAFTYARAEEIEGDYAEFGVWQGRTFLEAWRTGSAISGDTRRFFAFDSFAGLPAIAGPDAVGRFKAGEFRQTRRAFEGRLRRASIPRDRVHIVEGEFDHVLARPERIPLEKVAIAYIDSPIYQTTVPVLDYLTPRLAQGAVLMFDAWLCFHASPELGEARACREWLSRNPDLNVTPSWQYGWAGQAFIVRRGSPAPDVRSA